MDICIKSMDELKDLVKTMGDGQMLVMDLEKKGNDGYEKAISAKRVEEPSKPSQSKKAKSR